MNAVFKLSDSEIEANAKEIASHILTATCDSHVAKTKVEGFIRYLGSSKIYKRPNTKQGITIFTKSKTKLADSLNKIEKENQTVSDVINRHLEGAIIRGDFRTTPDAEPLIRFLMEKCPACIENLKPDEGPQGKNETITYGY